MKIPPYAKKVFDGIIFDVYQWEQKMFDGSTKTFEMIKRPGTIQIIPTIKDKILLSYEEQPTKPKTYTFLGGRQEENEEPLITAKRELLEETGFQSDDWELIKTYDPEMKIDWTIYLFVARNCSKISDPKLDSGEKIEVIEVTFDEFIDLASSVNFWGNDISNDLFRIKQNQSKLNKLKIKIYGDCKLPR